MARQGPRGGGKITASIRLQVWGHGLLSNTLDAMDKEIEFDRAGASFRRRRKRASTDQILPSFMPTSAKSVVEAATILLLAFSVIFGLVFCAPTLPAASFQQARECRGLVISRTSPTSVVEATTLTRLVSSAIFSRVLCAPTLPAASFQQARECRGLVSSRTYSFGSSRKLSRTLPRPHSRKFSRASSRASSRTPPGASFVQQQIAPSARAGLKTAIRHIHA